MTSSAAPKGTLIGHQVAGYAVRGLIGRGATGTVYLAHEGVLGRDVALKVILGSLARQEDLVEQFQREARAAAPLQHPNIVRIYAAGSEKGIPYIAMEYVEGETLERFLRRKGHVRWENALFIAQQIAEALEYAHQRHIVHRDVKPANIMLDRLGRVRLMDFGLASVDHEGLCGKDGSFVGTPKYMSPEQAQNQAVTGQSDLYSLGVVLYEMISGRVPFQGESSMALIKSILTDEPPRLNRISSTVPDDVARLVAWLMEKDPAKRPASGSALVHRILKLQEEKGGGSALPAAFRSFLLEQTEPRTVVLEGGENPSTLKKDTKTRKTFQRRRSIRRYGLALVAISVSVVLLLAGGYLRARSSTSSVALAARELSPTLLRRDVSGTAWVSSPAKGYGFNWVGWVGGQPVVAATLSGNFNTTAQGSSGMVAVDLETDRVLNISAPGRWEAIAPGIPTIRTSGLLQDSFVSVTQATVEGAAEVRLGAQHWNRGSSSTEVLATLPLARWQAPSSTPWETGWTGAVIPKPDGEALCVLLREEDGSGVYLNEITIGGQRENTDRRILTRSQSSILPQSIQYDPEGRFLAFLTEDAPQDRTLFIIEPGGSSGPRLLAQGPLGSIVSFSPTGRYIAYTRLRSSGQAPALEVAAIADGEVFAPGWRGYLARESWLIDDDTLVLASADPGVGTATEELQLWGVDARSNKGLKQLSHVEGGVSTSFAVARGNGSIAVADARRERLAIVSPPER